ncbi:class C sortase [Paenibacillus sp. NEAU-GSW1]|nr:class D sortase [Paenibacillus sp. NEAU-GSW1]MUT65857.1 class C sortase [Paenibacillus sp. NEAU-GSW1]
MRKLAYFLIIVGVLVIAYPKGNEWYANWQQNKLMQEWEQDYNETAEDAALQQFEDLTDLFNETADDTAVDTLPVAAAATSQADNGQADSENKQEEAPKLDTIGTISIPSIKVKLPILEGATQKNMKYGAAHMSETGKFGEIGNAAIAAHRAKTKGRLFNRLGEVKVGDKITITQKGKQFTYTVYNISIVKPTDVSVLNYNNKDKMLTLITCTPINKPTHRLIIHAKM